MSSLHEEHTISDRLYKAVLGLWLFLTTVLAIWAYVLIRLFVG
jgi:hypothetical protein